MSESALNFYFGDDEFTLSAAVQKRRAVFLRRNPTGETVLLDFTGENVEALLPQMAEALRGQSLFTDRKFAVLKNFFAAQRKTRVAKTTEIKEGQGANDTKSPAVETFLELVGGAQDAEIYVWENAALDKRSKAFKTFSAWREAEKMTWEEFAMPLQFAFNDWLLRTIKTRGGQIGKGEVEYLAQLLGKGMEQREKGKTLAAYDLFAAASEIDKLIAYAAGESITREMINLLVPAAYDMNIFSLIEAIGHKNRPRAFALLSRQIEQGFNENYILSMLVYHFRTLLAVRDLNDTGVSAPEIVFILKMKPWSVQKNLTYAKAFTGAQLKAIYSKLYNADRNIKNGSISPELALNLLLAVI